MLIASEFVAQNIILTLLTLLFESERNQAFQKKGWKILIITITKTDKEMFRNMSLRKTTPKLNIWNKRIPIFKVILFNISIFFHV